MRRLFIVLFTVVAFVFPVWSAKADDQKALQLELFGVPLKNASRDQLREALKQNGMQVSREDKLFWIDIYDARAVLEGASEFKAGYVAATNQFAFAEYTFPAFKDAFKDASLIAKVINMLSRKYGRPTTQLGNFHDQVTAKWHMDQDMLIEVAGGTFRPTILRFIDPPALNQMNSEIDSQKRQQTKSQTNAY